MCSSQVHEQSTISGPRDTPYQRCPPDPDFPGPHRHPPNTIGAHWIGISDAGDAYEKSAAPGHRSLAERGLSAKLDP
jgi:hypothetical protein